MMRNEDVHGKATRRRLQQVGLGLSVVIVMVSACGFHPRGSNIELSDAGRLFIDSDRDLSIEEPLRAALRERAFIVANNRDEADIVLRVADETQSQRIVSVRSTGRVSEYELAHAVVLTIMRVADQGADAGLGNDAVVGSEPGIDESAGIVATDGGSFEKSDDDSPADEAQVVTALAPAGSSADRVRVTREYTYDEAQVLGKENEARILRAELRDELVRQIVLRMVASLARSGNTSGLAGD